MVQIFINDSVWFKTDSTSLEFKTTYGIPQAYSKTTPSLLQNLYKSSRLLMEYYKSSPRLICFKVISSLSHKYFKTNLTKDYCNPYSRLLFDCFETDKPNFHQTSSRINEFYKIYLPLPFSELGTTQLRLV